jgi:hypothetical protein
MKSTGVKMRKIAIASVLGLALLIGMVTSALAITNGQTNRNEPPYVGLVVFDDGDGPAWRYSVHLEQRLKNFTVWI